MLVRWLEEKHMVLYQVHSEENPFFYIHVMKLMTPKWFKILDLIKGIFRVFTPPIILRVVTRHKSIDFHHSLSRQEITYTSDLARVDLLDFQ